MALSPGEKLGPYECIAPIGAGGMGQVYKARDTRLDRIVAIKTSAAQFSERFEREARAVAALNHPNICQLYDVGPDYLVMEFVEGAPVAAPDAARKLLDMAVQMSEGLAAAHAAGIIHRDLKPDNILMTREGRIKILDFGLAKRAPENAAPADATVTVARVLTDPGTTIGTIAYMSPEQARGQVNLTAQSDQFSLGLVLYELAAGKKAFQRGSVGETMTAIIREDAEPLPESLPTRLNLVIERLLAKEPSERYDSTRDLYRELKQIRDRHSEATRADQIPAGETAPVSAPLQPRFGRLPWIAAAVMTVTAIALSILYSRVLNTTAGPPANAVPVIVLMDTTAPEGVYDPGTRKESGTNADDLSDSLRDLPVVLHKENIGATWNREVQVLKQTPDLILIHRSALIHAMVLEFEHGFPVEGVSKPPRQVLYDLLNPIGLDKLEEFVGYAAGANPRTRFLVYSRGWPQANVRQTWEQSLERRFPAVKGRVFTIPIAVVDGTASFRDPKTIAQVKQMVRSILGLTASGVNQ